MATFLKSKKFSRHHHRYLTTANRISKISISLIVIVYLAAIAADAQESGYPGSPTGRYYSPISSILSGGQKSSRNSGNPGNSGNLAPQFANRRESNRDGLLVSSAIANGLASNAPKYHHFDDISPGYGAAYHSPGIFPSLLSAARNYLGLGMPGSASLLYAGPSIPGVADSGSGLPIGFDPHGYDAHHHHYHHMLAHHRNPNGYFGIATSAGPNQFQNAYSMYAAMRGMPQMSAVPIYGPDPVLAMSPPMPWPPIQAALSPQSKQGPWSSSGANSIAPSYGFGGVGETNSGSASSSSASSASSSSDNNRDRNFASDLYSYPNYHPYASPSYSPSGGASSISSSSSPGGSAEISTPKIEIGQKFSNSIYANSDNLRYDLSSLKDLYSNSASSAAGPDSNSAPNSATDSYSYYSPQRSYPYSALSSPPNQATYQPSYSSSYPSYQPAPSPSSPSLPSSYAPLSSALLSASPLSSDYALATNGYRQYLARQRDLIADPSISNRIAHTYVSSPIASTANFDLLQQYGGATSKSRTTSSSSSSNNNINNPNRSSSLSESIESFLNSDSDLSSSPSSSPSSSSVPSGKRGAIEEIGFFKRSDSISTPIVANNSNSSSSSSDWNSFKNSTATSAESKSQNAQVQPPKTTTTTTTSTTASNNNSATTTTPAASIFNTNNNNNNHNNHNNANNAGNNKHQNYRFHRKI